MQERLVFIQVLRACCTAAADSMWVQSCGGGCCDGANTHNTDAAITCLAAPHAAHTCAFFLGPVSCLPSYLCSPLSLPTTSTSCSCPPPPCFPPPRLPPLSHPSPACEFSPRPLPSLSSPPCTLLPSHKHNRRMDNLFLRLRNRRYTAAFRTWCSWYAAFPVTPTAWSERTVSQVDNSTR